MKKKFRIAAASNVLIPIYYLLNEKGFTLNRTDRGWAAENEEAKFIAEDLMLLAGLIYLWEHKGDDWKVDDEKIDAFWEKYF